MSINHRILGVCDNASEKEISQAFRTLSKKCHPDQNRNDPQGEARFKALNEAYDALKPKVLEATITLDELANGTEITLPVRDADGDPDEVAFDVAEGDREGDIIRGDNQRFKLCVTVADDDRFRVVGNDLHCSLKIRDYEAKDGKSVTIESVYGEEEIDIPSDTVNGAELRFEDLGLPIKNSHKRGVLVVTVEVTETIFDVDVTLADLVNGKDVSVRLGRDRWDTADFEVKAGHRPGDLVLSDDERCKIRLNLEEGERYTVKDNDLHCPVTLFEWEAVEGKSVTLKDVDDYDEYVNIPAGVQDGAEVRVANQGLPIKDSNQRGDIVVTVEIVEAVFDVKLTLEELAQGKEVTLSLPGDDDESVDFEIPQGHRDGDVISDSDDKYKVRLQVRGHRLYTVVGDDLHCVVNATRSQLEDGLCVPITTVYGDDEEIDIPEDVRNGKKLKFEDWGLPIKDSGERGMLIVTVNIVGRRQRG